MVFKRKPNQRAWTGVTTADPRVNREIKDSEVNQTKKFKQEIQNQTMGLTHEIKDFEICATKGNQTVEGRV